MVLLLAAWVSPAALAADKWLRGQSEHFEVVSSASEKDTRRLIVQLERFRENVLTMFPAPMLREPRVTVILFSSDSTFEPYKPRYKGEAKRVAGYFLNHPDETFIVVSTAANADYEETIFHEYVHFLVKARGMTLPVWLNEGLAEVLSTLKMEFGAAEYGEPKDYHVQRMAQTALMSIERMLAVKQNSPEYNETSRASVFYAQSWLLTHYLLCGRDQGNAARLEKFLARTETDTSDPAAAFTEIFGRTPAAMEMELRAYLSGGQFYKRRMKLQPIDESKITFRPATALESEAPLLGLKWRIHRSPIDVPPIYTLLQREPKAPEPHELLASVAMMKGERDSALTHWRQAADLQSTNAYIYVELTRDVIRRFRASELDERLTAEEAAQLQGWLDRALALRPGYPEAIAALAVVEARAPQLRAPGILAVQKALPTQREQRHATLLAYAMICWRAREIPISLKIVDSLVASSRTPANIRHAAEMLRLKAAGKTSPGGSIPTEPAAEPKEP